MPTNILSIQPRRQNFRTSTNADWLDGLFISQTGAAGIVAGADNVGNGSLAVASVSAGVAAGVYSVSVTSLDNSPRITVQDPDGAVIGKGVAGLQFYAAGITLTLTKGSTAFAVDDTFFISVLPTPIDITGIDFDLQIRLSATDPNVRFSATSHPASSSVVPTIALGGPAGTIALRILTPAMSPDKFPPGTYVYDLLASADGVRVVAFYGTIEHVSGVTFLR